MTHDDLTPDCELARTLRAFDGTPVRSHAELGALTQRIAMRAEPLLAGRRRVTPWWLFAAEWARALIPIGLTTAVVAAACILWAARAPHQAPVAMTASADGLTQRLLYSLVAPVEGHVMPEATPVHDR